jgi:hypothetical protein
MWMYLARIDEEDEAFELWQTEYRDDPVDFVPFPSDDKLMQEIREAFETRDRDDVWVDVPDGTNDVTHGDWSSTRQEDNIVTQSRPSDH